jgi:hypothetical protein
MQEALAPSLKKNMVNIQNYIMNPFETKYYGSLAFLCETYFIKSAKNSFQIIVQ